MTSCDTNILFAALDAESVHHLRARAFLETQRDADDFGLCELVLMELYGLLRNPAVCKCPYPSDEAAKVIQRFRTHPQWVVLDYPGPQAGIMRSLWQSAASPSFPYKRIYDLRLALTLRYHGVREFATRNIKDFEDAGFLRVWDPLAHPREES